jgi:rhodanese-related sulfurtransferase
MKHTYTLRSCLVYLLTTVFLGVGGCEKDSAWDNILSQVREDFPDVRMMTTQELADWQADPQRDPPLLLDVRAAQEYGVSHLRGAVLADSDSALRAALDGIDPARPIVVYCSVGYRSAQAARDIQKLGFQNVTNLEGSIFAWANEGRPVFRDGKPTDKVHPYDQRWGKLLDKRYHPPR